MLKATLRGLIAHKGRLTMSLLAVTLSVAFVAGTLLFTDTITRTFHELTTSTTADLTVTAASSGASSTTDDEDAPAATLPAATVAKVRTVDGVGAVHAVVE